jgi:F-type H+-transporting ATPase subunit beta
MATLVCRERIWRSFLVNEPVSSQVLDTGTPIRIPVGDETLGRIINVIGDPIDERGPINTTKRAAIHAEAPEFSEMSVEQEILVTGY